MSGPIPTRAVAALEAIEAVRTEGRPSQDVVADVVERIAHVVATDGFFAGATDPETGLCLSGTVYNYDARICSPYWENELLEPDYNKFAELTPAHPVADLRRATGGRLERSARYRTFSAISDLEDEVRVAFHAGGRRWGQLQLNRHTGGPPFTDADLAFLRAAAPIAGEVFRAAVLDTAPPPDPSCGPGVVILDRFGHVRSVTAEAELWLDRLSRGRWRREDTEMVLAPEVHLVARGALGGAARRARLRTSDGVWLVVQASSLGDGGQVALVIEPAKASEIAPIIIEAYGLTPREVEVTQMIARGLSTEQIASELCLSRHTVRDYLKAIFEKTGVSSRGELTSKLFAEHYKPTFDATIYGAMDAVAERMSGLAVTR